MATPTQTRRILIKVDTGDSKAINELASKMGMLNKNTKSLADNMGFLSNTFRAWLGYLGIRELTRMSDEMQNLFNRLKLITGSIEGATEALRGLEGIADRTNQSIGGVGEVYNRLSLSLKDSKATSKELLTLTETLINTFRVAGTTTAETTQTIIQLSQAFSSGQLRGDELRSVMEQNVVLAGLLKQRFGSDLYAKAKEGAITVTEVLKVLAANQEKINQGAKELAPTFEQTLTKSFNKLTLSVGQLNRQFELSAKFAAVMEFAMNNLGSVLLVLGEILFALALTRIPAMISALEKLRIAMIGLSAGNVLLLALTSIATVLFIVAENSEKVGKAFTSLNAKITDFAADVEEAGLKSRQGFSNLLGNPENLERMIANTKKGIEDARKRAQAMRESLLPVQGPQQDPAAEMQRNMQSLIEKMGAGKEKAKSLKEELGELNSALLDNKISLAEYNEKLSAFELHKVVVQFQKGKTDIFKFNEAISKIQIGALNRALKEGSITLDEFNKGVADSRLYVLNQQLAAGKIALAEYNEELAKLDDRVRPGSGFYSGVHDFIESAGTLSQGIAKVTSQAFDHLSDTLTDFIKTGKLNFADFTRAVLDDITAMIVRAAIVRPIAQGILGLIGMGAAAPVSAAPAPGGFSIASPGEFQFASGGIMTSKGPLPLNMYSAGGIANSPQMAMFGEGRTPEAFVPLPDGRSIPVQMQGDGGGVSVTQVFHFNSDGSEASATTTGGNQKAKEFGELMKRVATDTIVREKRPGGLLFNG